MNLSVLIGTCDKYKSLWEPFQICFNRYWKHNTNNIFVTDTLDVPTYTETKFNTIKAQGNWGSRMLKGIESIKEDYIFFILEDYLFHYSYSEKQLNNYLELAKRHNIDRLQISPGKYETNLDESVHGLDKVFNNNRYSISMQPSIWKKEFLVEILLPNYSAWDFELKGSKALKNLNKNIFIDKNIPSVYFNAVRKGMRKSSGFSEFFKRENLKEFDL